MLDVACWPLWTTMFDFGALTQSKVLVALIEFRVFGALSNCPAPLFTDLHACSQAHIPVPQHPYL